MGVLVVIGLLGFIGCIVLLIWSALKKKTKRYWAIGVGISLILFVVGVVGLGNENSQSTISNSPPTTTGQEPVSYSYNNDLADCDPVNPATGQPLDAQLQFQGNSGFRITNSSEYTFYSLQVYVDVNVSPNVPLSGNSYGYGQTQTLSPGQSFSYNNTNIEDLNLKHIDFSALSGNVDIDMSAQITPGGPFIAVTPQIQNNSQTTSTSLQTTSQTAQLLTYTDTTPGDTTQGVSINYPKGWIVTPGSSGYALQFQSPTKEGSVYACDVAIVVPTLTQVMTLQAFVQQTVNNESASDGISGDYFKTEGSISATAVAGYQAYEVMFTQKQSGLVFNGMDVYIQTSNGEIYHFSAAVFEPAQYSDYSSIINEMLSSLQFNK